MFDKIFLSKILTESEVTELLEPLNFIIIETINKDDSSYYYAINIVDEEDMYIKTDITLSGLLFKLYHGKEKPDGNMELDS